MKLKAIPAMLSMIPSVIKGPSVQDLERIKAITRSAFPQVRQISTKGLAEWMSEDNPPLLIDVRSPDEYAVSHLAGAVNLRTSSDIRDLIAKRRPSKTVLYCAVGFRSSRIAQDLADQSERIFNLEGSIFEWANEGRPLFRGKAPVRKVHPYSKRWAGLLKPELVSKAGKCI